MLVITVPKGDVFDEKNSIFIKVDSQTLQLEHSLIAISKWESTWCKPFLDNKDKSKEEILDYIRCMTITKGVNPLVYFNMKPDVLNKITTYIDSPMTATTINDLEISSKKRVEIFTSEVIYYYMIALGIPVEFQKWHLNRLITLIKVCNIKNQPKGKNQMSQKEILQRNRELNAQRRAKYNTKG